MSEGSNVKENVRKQASLRKFLILDTAYNLSADNVLAVSSAVSVCSFVSQLRYSKICLI